MNGYVTALVVIVLIAAVIVRRFLGEPLNARDLTVPPLVLCGIGVYSLVHDSGAATPGGLGWTVAAAAVGFGVGTARGATIRLFTRDGVLWQRYTGWTLAVWALAVAVKLGMGAVAGTIGVDTGATPVTLSIGAGLLGEMVPVGLRALRSGVPFAPEESGAGRIIRESPRGRGRAS